MTSGQRKIHRFSWIAITIIVPILIFFSVRNLDFQQKENSSSFTEIRNETILKSAENEFLKINQYTNSIEVIVKSPLKTSSSVLYSIDERGNKRNTLGQVSTVGIYRFEMNQKIQGIILYDEIKESEITKLSL